MRTRPQHHHSAPAIRTPAGTFRSTQTRQRPHSAGAWGWDTSPPWSAPSSPQTESPPAAASRQPPSSVGSPPRSAAQSPSPRYTTATAAASQWQNIHAPPSLAFHQTPLPRLSASEPPERQPPSSPTFPSKAHPSAAANGKVVQTSYSRFCCKDSSLFLPNKGK